MIKSKSKSWMVRVRGMASQMSQQQPSACGMLMTSYDYFHFPYQVRDVPIFAPQRRGQHGPIVCEETCDRGWKSMQVGFQ